MLKEIKMPIIINLLYEKYQNDIVGIHYLPMRSLVDLMKNLEIIPNTISLSKFLHTCLWYKKKEEGFNRS